MKYEKFNTVGQVVEVDGNVLASVRSVMFVMKSYHENKKEFKTEFNRQLKKLENLFMTFSPIKRIKLSLEIKNNLGRSYRKVALEKNPSVMLSLLHTVFQSPNSVWKTKKYIIRTKCVSCFMKSC